MQWVEAVKTAVGINLHLLARMIPKLKKIFPSTISTEFLSAEALEMRFKYAFSKFLQVSVSYLKSLTLFFDDCQCASVTAIQLFASLIQKFTLKNVLILGAYRSTEVTEVHPLKTVIQSLKKMSSFAEINLNPLTLHDLQQWLSESLYQSLDAVKELTIIC